MLDVVIGIFIFVGVIAVTTLLFSGWAIYGVIRAVVSGIGALISSSSSPSSRPALTGEGAGQTRCPRARCHAHNPPGATFCRRCGCSLTGNAGRVPALPPQRRQVFAASAAARAASAPQRNYG